MGRLAMPPPPRNAKELERQIAMLEREWRSNVRMTVFVYAIGLLFFLFLAVSGVFADDTTFPEPKKKRARKPPAVKKVPDPVPVCRWSPVDPSPCECWWKPIPGGQWEWFACPPPVERLAEREPLVFEELPIPEPEPPPLPVPVPVRDEPGLRLRLEGWTLAGFSGEAEETLTYGGRLAADGPLAHAWRAPVRIFAVLDLATMPGKQASLSSLETFGRSAEFRAGSYLRLARSDHDGGQVVTSSVIGWAGFATAINGDLQDRYQRSFGLGVRLAEETSGAALIVGYCRDELVGYIGAGGVCIQGSVPITGTNGAMLLGGSAVLNLSRASVTPQRDRLILWLAASVGDIVDAVRGRR